MNKTTLTILTIITVAGQSAFADIQNKFYIKAAGGYSKLDKVHNFKSENSGFLGVGIGLNVTDNIRTDLMFEHLINVVHKGSRVRGKIQRNHKTKGKIESLTCNGYIDLFDFSAAKVFVGAGIGVAKLEAKNTFLNTRTGNVRSSKYKAKTNFAFALHTGVSLEVTPKVTSELFYSYKDFGKTKTNIANRKIHYKGHQAGMGLRFNI